MIKLAASAIASAIVNAASIGGYETAWYGEFSGNEYPTPARLTSALIDAMAGRIGIRDVPVEICNASAAIVKGNGATVLNKDINTSDIPGYGDGIMYSWGQLYVALVDVARFIPTVDEEPFILRLALDTIPGIDDIELVSVVAWDGAYSTYRVEEVAMMRYMS